MIIIKMNKYKKVTTKLLNLIYKYSNNYSSPKSVYWRYKIAFGNQNDTQHKSDSRILKELAASIPSGRIISKVYPYVKKGVKSSIDWGYKNPDKVERIQKSIERLDGFYGGTPPGYNLGSTLNGINNLLDVSK